MKMDMSSEFPEEDIFATFPCLCFPDVEDMELRIDEEEKALHITGTDSEWPLDGDLVLAAGAGCMSFFYSGDLRFEVEGPEGTRSIAMSEARQKDLPQAKDIRLIKRGQPWELMFSAAKQAPLKIVADITAVSWTPEEWDPEEDE